MSRSAAKAFNLSCHLCVQCQLRLTQLTVSCDKSRTSGKKNLDKRRLLAVARLDLAEHIRFVQGNGWTFLHLSSNLPEMSYSLWFAGDC